MRPPRWKKWLSYLIELHIESAPSAHNPHLYVSLKNGRYQLCTANAVYSYEDLYDNFAQTFQQLNFSKLKGNRVLILGFGLGSIVQQLEQQFHQKYEYTGVEIDENVLFLANKYIVPELSSPLTLICTNARVFVELCQEEFDLIAVDIFLDDIIPDEFQQTDFLEKIKTLLTPNGLLLYNRLAYTKKDIQQNKDFFQSVFTKVFPNAHYLKVRGNWMLMNREM